MKINELLQLRKIELKELESVADMNSAKEEKSMLTEEELVAIAHKKYLRELIGKIKQNESERIYN